jgi:hypothetical protein
MLRTRMASTSLLLLALLPPIDFYGFGEKPASNPKTSAEADKNVQVSKGGPICDRSGEPAFRRSPRDRRKERVNMRAKTEALIPSDPRHGTQVHRRLQQGNDSSRVDD